MRRLFAVCLAWTLLVGCNGTERKLERSAALNDPARMALKPGYDPFVSGLALADGMQVGLIRMRDGRTAKFWFLSHHLTDDEGLTRFELPDGSVHFLRGVFCCEVMFPRQPKDAQDLLEMIRDLDGEQP